MKKCLIVMANPSLNGFANALATEFRSGLEFEDHSHETINLFQENYLGQEGQFLEVDYKELIMGCDGMAFSFPLWWEMPPYPLVAFFQKIFTAGFAYNHDGVNKTPLLDLPVQLIVTQGQKHPANLLYLYEALRYCGFKTKFNTLSCTNVTPNLSPTEAGRYKKMAFEAGTSFFQ
jgi:putative NADPH-quinone reductase